jgi:hypothetical protein
MEIRKQLGMKEVRTSKILDYKTDEAEDEYSLL